MTMLPLRRSRWLVLAIGVAMFGLAVGKLAAPVAAADIATKEKEKVDLNTASEKDLETLPGVGDATAKKIIAGRPYKSIGPALSKAGLNDAEIAKLKGLVTYTEPKTETKAADKLTEKKSDKTADKGKAAENGKMTADSKTADAAKDKTAKSDSKMDAKSAKDATAKSTDKPADKTAKTDKPADKKSGAAEPAGPKVDLNTASETELKTLPGVGDATAKKIVEGRPYKSIEGLAKAGVNEAEIAKLKPLVLVSDVKVSAKTDSKVADAGKSDKRAEKKETAKDTKKEKDKEKPTVSTTPPPTDKEIKDATAKKLVWANLNSKVYHESSDRWYGKTKHGKFMTEDEAKKEGYTKAHMNENSDEPKGSTT